jgi:hypothetical protein
LQGEVVQEVIKRKAGGRVKADFALFPSREMTKVRLSVKTVLFTIFRSKYELKKTKLWWNNE